jgi:signal transduction histidine kinase
MAFSRRHWLKLQPQDVSSVLLSHLEKLRQTTPKSIVIRHQFIPALVLADSATLEQAIAGLTANAIEAMPLGGTLALTTELANISQGQTTQHSESVPGSYVVITVSDTGKGMPPEVVNRMFEPFFTTKDVGQGTGLGLAAVYGIIKQHYGWIESESSPGHGTTIRIWLPLEPES